MIDKIDFRSKRENKGFEIIALKDFFESADPHYINRPYRTNFYTLLFVTKGTCSHEVDFVDYTLNAGQLLVISNNRVHKYTASQNAEGYFIMFTEGYMCEYLSDSNTGVKALFKQSHLQPHIKSIDLYIESISTLLELILSMYTNPNDVINDKVIAANIKTLVQIISNNNQLNESSKAQNNEMFVQFTDLVEKHITTERSVSAYARMMHVSEKTVNLITRKAIDMSAKQYILTQLVQKIKIKLSFEQKSINEIAYDLSFTEASNMTRLFKKLTEMSPKDFRQRARRDKKTVFESENMDLSMIRDAIEKRVYHVVSSMVVPFHKHLGHDEIFYCIKGSGYGVLEEREVYLEAGDMFVATAGTQHTLRTDKDMYVVSIVIPLIIERKSHKKPLELRGE